MLLQTSKHIKGLHPFNLQGERSVPLTPGWAIGKEMEKGEIRNYTFRIRVNPKEKDAVERRKEIGFTMSEWLRSLALGQEVKEKRKRRAPPKVDPELVRHLAKLGSNLNQIARAANIMKIQDSPVELVELNLALCSIERELKLLRTMHERHKNNAG